MPITISYYKNWKNYNSTNNDTKYIQDNFDICLHIFPPSIITSTSGYLKVIIPIYFCNLWFQILSILYSPIFNLGINFVIKKQYDYLYNKPAIITSINPKPKKISESIGSVIISSVIKIAIAAIIKEITYRDKCANFLDSIYSPTFKNHLFCFNIFGGFYFHLPYFNI